MGKSSLFIMKTIWTHIKTPDGQNAQIGAKPCGIYTNHQALNV